MNDYTAKALESWYKPDNPLYRDPRHPLIKLAGEAGELLDLYGKHEYKPGFDWWNCKKCLRPESDHHPTSSRCNGYIPLVLDELGDWFYYWRIAYFIYDRQLRLRERYDYWELDKTLTILAQNSTVLLTDYLDRNRIDGSRLEVTYGCFVSILDKLDCTLDHLADLNYRKLNSDATQHGWSEAR